MRTASRPRVFPISVLRLALHGEQEEQQAEHTDLTEVVGLLSRIVRAVERDTPLTRPS